MEFNTGNKVILGKTIYIRILTFSMLLYAFSIYSYYEFIPDILRKVVLLCFPILLIVFYLAKNLLANFSIKKSVSTFCAFFMLIVMLVWKNYSIANEGIVSMYGLILPLAFFFVGITTNEWHDTFLRIMVVFGTIYAIGTLICLLVPSVYYQFIGPLMERAYPQAGYIQNAKAGFTAHYSTNGMYLANGIIASLTIILKNKSLCKKTSLTFTLIFIVQLMAFLICGKRGTTLCIILSFYITYFVYMSKNPKGRVFKLILISFFAVIFVYAGSLFLPELSNVYTRLLLMMNQKDISTGRFYLWSAGWKDFLTSPLVGHGWRWFYYNDASVFINHDVHNVYIQLLCETGLLGSIPFFLFFAVNFSHSLKLVRLWRQSKIDLQVLNKTYYSLVFCVCYQAFFLIFIFEGTAFYNPEALVPYFASCAMTEYFYREYRYKRFVTKGVA